MTIPPPAPSRFKAGDIIRYARGVSALFRYSGTNNAERLYGEHVLGGAHAAADVLFFDLELASETDLAFCRERRPEWFAAPSTATLPPSETPSEP